MDLGPRFDVRAINVADRIDVRGVEPRMSNHLPVTVSVDPSGCAMLFRSGAVVFFGVDPMGQERFLRDLEPRMLGRYETPETERAVIKLGDADSVEPDALILREASIERLQVVAEILAKSVVVARNEQNIGKAFAAIEPLAHQMTSSSKLPLRQRELVRYIGEATLVEHALVDRAEVLEKPELLWDRPDLDRLYARLEDEYEIRERHLVLESKLSVVSTTARTLLELNQARSSLKVEYYIVALIVFEIALSLYEMATH
jgi:uncharacterized Rmd1/YagE family protein